MALKKFAAAVPHTEEVKKAFQGLVEIPLNSEQQLEARNLQYTALVIKNSRNTFIAEVNKKLEELATQSNAADTAFLVKITEYGKHLGIDNTTHIFDADKLLFAPIAAKPAEGK